MNLPHTTKPESRCLVAGAASDLEGMLSRVENELAALGDALRLRDGNAIEGHAQQLQLALERAVQAFHSAARGGGIPAPLRTRLVKASGQVAAQRESLVRATVALDRAIDALMPRDTPAIYGSRGWMGQGTSAYLA
jgi:hypothetical protein